METTLDKIIIDLENKRNELTAKVNELVLSQEELAKVTSALAALKGQMNDTSNKSSNNNSSIKWKDLKWKEKIDLVIAEKKEAGTADISAYIKEKEPSLIYSTIYNTVAQVASKMLENEELKARRDGKKFIYYK